MLCVVSLFYVLLIRFVNLGKPFTSESLYAHWPDRENQISLTGMWGLKDKNRYRVTFNTYLFIFSLLLSPDNNFFWLIWACELFRLKYRLAKLDGKGVCVLICLDTVKVKTTNALSCGFLGLESTSSRGFLLRGSCI